MEEDLWRSSAQARQTLTTPQSKALDVVRPGVPVDVCEGLIKAGAFDRLEPHRGLLLALLPQMAHRRSFGGQGRLAISAEESSLPELPPLALRDRLAWEWDLLGFSLGTHPVDLLEGRAPGITRMRDLGQCRDGQTVRLAGSVVRYQTPSTRSGKRVVFVCLEDGTGLADLAIFEDVQRESGDVLFKSPWLLVEGKVRRRGPRAMSITAVKLERMVTAEASA